MGQEAVNPVDIQQESDRYWVRSSFLVQAGAAEAFGAFTAGMADWWVQEYTWSGPEELVDIGIEPRAGGMCYEIGPYGFRSDWGRVLVWEPPHRLVFTWQIGADRVPVPNPARSSEVEVRFAGERPDRTAVQLEHRHFDRHGPAAEGYRHALTIGWHELLSRYAAAVTARHGGAG